MIQKDLVYFTLWFLLQLFIEINCQMTPYKQERSRHTATLIDNKLYILGGHTPFKVGKDFFYLDVSVPFNTQKLSWKELSNINTVPSHYAAASVNGGENNNMLFLYGGVVLDNSAVTDFVYIFNPQSNSWSIPQISNNIPPKLDGNVPLKKSRLTGIKDQNGNMYLWGGTVKTLYDYNNDMLILDTKKLILEQRSSFNAPTARMNYGATLLPDNKIIYMGGDNGKSLALNQVYLYDTINDNWSTKTTSGLVPSGRDGLSVVLGSDGQRIIIFGGVPAITPEASLYELNVINFEWRIPKISGIIPKSRAYHRANVIGKYMVITFGEDYDRFTESDILLLDISNVDEYIWTNEFYPSPPQSSTKSGKVPPSPSAISPSATAIQPSIIVQSQSAPSMTGAIIGSLIGGATLSSVGFFLYRWNKNRQKRDNNNQEEKNTYNHGQEIEQIPKNEYITNHEPISAPDSIITNCSNHGQESIPIVDDNRLTLHELKQEIQDLRQIIIQSNKQSTNPIK